MVENLSRKLTILVSLLVVALFSLAIMGFNLGLDLQGGTRLVYSVDVEKAVEDGKITQQEAQDTTALFNDLVSIWRDRIDPQGVREVVVRREGTSQISIEIPGSASVIKADVRAPLAEEIPPDHQRIDLEAFLQLPPDADPGAPVPLDEDALSRFPSSGGVVEIGGERMRYGQRVGNALLYVERGIDGTTAQPHPAGTDVALKASDPWRELIENVGDLQFFIRAQDGDLRDLTSPADTTDLTSEQTAVEEWVAANPETSISEYNAELQQRPGPVSRLRWYPMKAETVDQVANLAARLQPLIIEENLDWQFDGEDLHAVYPSQDDLGLPAVGFQMSDATATYFADFTEEHEGEPMAIVISGEIVTMPRINEKLPGGGIINGGASGFTFEEMSDLIKVLRSGSLKIKPEFESQETIGATLGQDYVRRGFTSALLGLAIVLAFMAFYYKRLGLFACVSLLYNLALLLGAMAFIRATLTLPGVAGIILTVGMAVDANILIYERIREEALKGRKPLQSAKDGFGNALSTIVDANLTTLITGLILYKFGSGPIKGFATTLCIGIITSMISALMLTRVLVHFALEKGVEAWNMRRWVSEVKIDFLSRTKVALACSTVAIVAGLAYFSILPSSQKLGIDFLGGTTLTIRTEEPQPVDHIRDLLKPGQNPNLEQSNLFTASADVKPITNTGVGGGQYTSFRIIAKTPEADQTTIERDIQGWFQDVLQKGPVVVDVTAGVASGDLYFERSHPEADIATALNKHGLTGAQASRHEGTDVYAFSGTVVGNKTAADLVNQLQQDLLLEEDAAGNALVLSSPISELTSVGAQVVEDLRDKAVVAVLMSLFAAVMYIRVRFAEYAYGLAAVLALTHDVLFTIGALAVANTLGLATEINLSMIAAFLTIIGYSLNDTIVIFDRVRENLPRMNAPLRVVINKSINQTLARTLLTSGTTLIAVLLLFGFNYGTGNVIEGFSFAMIIGVLVGTYSTIFVASPALLWLEGRRQSSLGKDAESPQAKEVGAASS